MMARPAGIPITPAPTSPLTPGQRFADAAFRIMSQQRKVSARDCAPCCNRQARRQLHVSPWHSLPCVQRARRLRALSGDYRPREWFRESRWDEDSTPSDPGRPTMGSPFASGGIGGGVVGSHTRSPLYGGSSIETRRSPILTGAQPTVGAVAVTAMLGGRSPLVDRAAMTGGASPAVRSDSGVSSPQTTLNPQKRAVELTTTSRRLPAAVAGDAQRAGPTAAAAEAHAEVATRGELQPPPFAVQHLPVDGASPLALGQPAAAPAPAGAGSNAGRGVAAEAIVLPTNVDHLLGQTGGPYSLMKHAHSAAATHTAPPGAQQTPQ